MATTLEIQVLGELSVRWKGELRPLPRSRKTRALLAYLAVTGREHRRDQLCSLLWDVVDDPRAALRWSLSKLRKVLGEAAEGCLVATRDRIALQLEADMLDLGRLRPRFREGFETLATEELEALADDCRGELLEGMLLPDFDTFEAWMEAERGDARRMQAQLRRVLVERLQGDAARALPHARQWFQRSGEQEARAWVDRLSAQIDGGAQTTLGAPARPTTHRPALGPAPTPDAPRRSMVGRDAEMSRLLMIADEARAQHGARVVLLLGEPGMGKTRLLEELRYRAREPAPCVVAATFHEAERNRPLAPFLDATREELASVLPEEVAAAAPDREQLFETLAGLIRRGAEDAGLGLLLLDDAHSSDASSCELLHYVVRTAARSPLLTVVACRPAELEDNDALLRAITGLRRRHWVEEVRLGALDEHALRSLIRSESSAALEDHLVTSSAGNPLLALEMARASKAIGAGVPQTLTDLVLARLAGLTEGARVLVRWATVLEQGSIMVLEQACAGEVEDFVDALEAATRYDFLRVDPDRPTRFSMSHALIQRVVYDAISAVRRAAMHRSLTEILSRGPQRAELSSIITHHATRADRPDIAARAMVAAAERCAAIGAVGEAADLADRARELLPKLEPGSAFDIELEASLVLAQVRRPADAPRFVARMTELGLAALERDEPELAHRAFSAASNLRWEAGASREGYGLARQAWHASRTGTATQRVRASSFMALCMVLMERQLPDAQTIVHEAETLTEAGDQAVAPAELNLARGLLHLHAGRLDDARQDALDSRTLARLEQGPLFEAMALQFRIQLEHTAGREEAWIAAAEELLSLAPRMREGGEGALASAAIALAETDIEEARGGLTRATEDLRVLDDKRRLAWVCNRWARREREEGDRDAAQRLAHEALEAAQAVDAMSEAAIAACELMALASLDGRDASYADAEQTLAELEESTTLSFEARQQITQITRPSA